MRRPASTTTVAALLALTVMYLSITFGSTVAGGADQYSYVTQAGLWRTGTLQIHQDIVRDSPWPGAPETWTPLGFRTIPGDPSAIASVYPPGLPLLMALFQAVAGYCGAFLVVPCCAALTVWLTYLLGRRLFDAPQIALVAAALVAVSPVFLYQIMNAMSDVPATAAWTLALLLLVSDRPLLSGLAVGAATLIRPNLAPVSGVFVLWLAVTNRASVWRLAAGLVPAVGAILVVNWRMYGSPLTSGYGDPGQYYAWEYALANLRRYPVWIVDTQTPLVLLSLGLFVAPAWLPRPRVSHLQMLLGGFIGILFLSYLFYAPFDAWWFLRFLLPMWPAIMVLAAVALETIARRWTGRWSSVVVWAIVAAVGWRGVRLAGERSAFDLGWGDRRYVNVARFVAEHTEPDAVVLSRQHSGSIRHYAGRLTLRFDMLDRAALDRAIAFLVSSGRPPYLVLDGDEVPMFQERFAGRSRLAALDRSPLATLAAPAILVFDLREPARTDAPLAIATLSTRPGWRCTEPPIWPPLLRLK
jgi:dolichyl-phosphate-mannose-protein mannosyltransferase